MKKQTQIPDEKSFYRLPFEKGTFELTEKTLNLNSQFRKPDYYYRIQTRNINFLNEILILAVLIKDEPEQLIFLKVTQYELLVCCNVDTDAAYLSRFAYFGLLSLMDYSSSVHLDEYYWPDFFDSNSGKSQFLKIYNDRKGLDIELKTKYPHFYKPGDELIDWYKEAEMQDRNTPISIKLEDHPIKDTVLGYFLADTNLSSIHSNHYSFLVPFVGISTKDKRKVKSFSSFVFSESDLKTADYATSSTQNKLIEISQKMLELAPVGPSYWRRPFCPDGEEKKNGNQLLELWHKAKNSLLSQHYIYYYYTHGLNYLKGKPMKNWICSYKIQKEQPHLIIKIIDKGRYYQLELKFRVNRKTYSPENQLIPFFINASTDKERLYLLNDFREFQLMLFFSYFGYRFAVLKAHYKDEIKDFIDGLAERHPDPSSNSSKI